MYHPPSPSDLESIAYELAAQHLETHSLTKVSQASAAPPHRVLAGLAIGETPSLAHIVYRRNLALDDNGDVILQRFGPSSASDAKAMATEAKMGAQYLEVLYRDACGHPANCVEDEDEPDPKLYEFGAVYIGNDPYISWQTAQVYKDVDPDRNFAGRKAVANFCAWSKLFAKRFIVPILEDPASQLCESFRTKLQDRMQSHFPWAAERVPGLKDLCQPFWSSLQPAKGFTTTPKIDGEVSDPLIMINMGQHALFELCDYHTSVELQPLDIVVYSADRFKHRVMPHPQSTGRDLPERWSVVCCFARAFEQREEPTDDVIALFRQAEIRMQEQQELQVRNDAANRRDGNGANCSSDDGVIHTGTKRSKRKATKTESQ